MKKTYLYASLFALLLTQSNQVLACTVSMPRGQTVDSLHDPLIQILQTTATCPKDVLQFRTLLQQEGASFKTTMVANRGFHNPRLGSFSFFEMVEIENPSHLAEAVQADELFFGHFTTPGSGNTLTLEQDLQPGALLIELIAWDAQKDVYNFYELLGTGQGSTWFYRGDSQDIWADTTKLHLARAAGEPAFGNRLRCSGCHVAGGPIMKEITAPHDSWWQKDLPLPLGGRTPDNKILEIMKTLQSPEVLRSATVSGSEKLAQGKAFQAKQAASPQVALRPLFCPEEINLASSSNETADINVPQGFFIDERLAGSTLLSTSKEFYMNALQKLNSHFPETNFNDAAHPWHTPVKAMSDQVAIANLEREGVIDKELVTDVLAIDMTRPVFSPKRCALLTLVPAKWTSDWQKQWQSNLAASTLSGAQELLENFVDPTRTENFHTARAQKFLAQCGAQLARPEGVQQLVTYLGQLRAEVSASEISKNPRGQILEPGFRVIFPTFTPAPKAWSTTLSEKCLPGA